MKVVTIYTTTFLALTMSLNADGAPISTARVTPNIIGHISTPLRYHPEGMDFVIHNGKEFFNRPLYGGHTAFRVNAGDKPEFSLYLPGRGGNLRLGIKTPKGVKWLKDAADIVTRYRPGELIYEIKDPIAGKKSVITIEVMAYAATEGLVARIKTSHPTPGMQLIWAYGGVNGERGGRDGDIGTERLPISQFFQIKPEFTKDNVITVDENRFTLKSTHATIIGVMPYGSYQHIADASHWNNLPDLLSDTAPTSAHPIAVGRADIVDGKPLYISLQRLNDPMYGKAGELQTYLDVKNESPTNDTKITRTKLSPAFSGTEIAKRFDDTRKYFNILRTNVRIETPDPYINAAMAAVNIAADAVWDDDAQAIMHGAIAWRTALLGWRGPYALDDLGTHDRARRNLDTWTMRQNTSPIPATVPPPDPSANLSRNEPGLHSNGDISGSHYDMNKVFIDALLRHISWTGDVDYARKIFPVIERHIAWQKRLFRREYGPSKLPLYEAYADIWASDGLYYNGAGTSYASAYNIYANRMAARIAQLVGKNSDPYTKEASAIEAAMHNVLWIPDRGTFAETKDIFGNQLLHPSYGLWSYYHTIDEEAVSQRESWSMSEDLMRSLPKIPVIGAGVPTDRPYHMYAETDWMPYTWSDNNVVMNENTHTALALWQSGQVDEAFNVLKGSILAGQFMGITPGNSASLMYLDVYRRESQSDFADSTGTLARALVEGLFGIHPDGLAGRLTVTPGFPANWDHASIHHPDFDMSFRRVGRQDTWTIKISAHQFQSLQFRIPAEFDTVAGITVNGKSSKWHVVTDAVGRPQLAFTVDAHSAAKVKIMWAGKPINSKHAPSGPRDGNFVRMTQGRFTWWSMITPPKKNRIPVVTDFNWNAPITGRIDTVDLQASFNDSIPNIFIPGKYTSPRPKGVSLAIPSQGYGEWTHPKDIPSIDDSGLRRTAKMNGGKVIMPNGVTFATPYASNACNVSFTSLWDNHSSEIHVPLSGHAKHLYLLMAGTTNHQQSRIDNGEVLVSYVDGTTARLALRNPESWWPIEQDYFIDDYQFVDEAPLPARIDLKSGNIRILDAKTFKGTGREVKGGAATALQIPLDQNKTLKSLTVRAIANEVIIGLMSASLER